MPIQAPQWTEYLSCPVCENGFDLKVRLPISLSCGHSICQECLATLHRGQCPFCPQGAISNSLNTLPINTALLVLIDQSADIERFRLENFNHEDAAAESQTYHLCMSKMECLASFLRPVIVGTNSVPTVLSRPMQRKLVSLINCQLMEEEGRSRAIKAARSLGERSVTELILQHQNPQQLSALLWAAVRARGCQFLGPAMQEEVLKLVLLALEDGSALSRKILVMFVVQKLEPQFPQASKTSIGHVVQLLYRASCFKVTKRDGDSSLMQLKEEFRSYDTLRREHDGQIVQIATEAGLRIAPDQWSSLLYGDTAHKSHMQSIIDKLQTPQSFGQSIQELVVAIQRSGDPGHLSSLRVHLDQLALIDVGEDAAINHDLKSVLEGLTASCSVVSGLINFISNHVIKKHSHDENHQNATTNSRYKTSMCRDLSMHGSCPRGKHCTFAHSAIEIETYRIKRTATPTNNSRPSLPPPPLHYSTRPPPSIRRTDEETDAAIDRARAASNEAATQITPMVVAAHVQPPVARVGPLPRGGSVVQEVAPQTNILVRPQTPIAYFPANGQAVAVQQMPVQHVQVPVQIGIGFQGHQPQEILRPSQPPPMMEDHAEELHRQQPVGEMKTDLVIGEKTQTLATRSLSALRNRKEQIKDTLEDMIGKDEMERLTAQDNNYSVSVDLVSVASLAASSTNSNSSTTTTIVSQISTTTTTSQQQYQDDDLIPFSDTPQVSRFGPISRRGQSIMRPSKPSNTLATIEDEPRPTPVVRHSKQIASFAPPASLILQNGGRTALQPVAVGANGEIGYIAVADPGAGAVPLAMMSAGPADLQNNSAALAMQTENAVSDIDAAAVYAESERMKKDLEILQQKISHLNLTKNLSSRNARQTSMEQQQQQQSRQTSQQVPRHVELASELQLIEKTIRDREMELQTSNCMKKSDSPRGLDYGSYLAQGLVDPLESNREHGGNNATSTTTMTYSRIANTNLVPLYPPDGSADFQRQ